MKRVKNTKGNMMKVWREWSNMEKKIASILFLLHLCCIVAPFQFNWSAFWIAFALYVITSLFGNTISYHRNLSHRSLKLSKWCEYLFAYCGVHALQGDPIDWVSTHRFHHQFADTEKDPHSPIQGFLFSYFTWIFDSYGMTRKVCPKDNCEEMERGIFVVVKRYGRPDNVEDLEKQAFYMFIHKTYLLHPLALAIILYAIGGTPFLVWGMGVRTVVFLHTTFMVNLICHTWGHRQWNGAALSTNNWWLSLITFGEGWHNNHHAFEYSAKLGLEWWQIDFGWYVIMFLQAIGVATHVKLPSLNQTQKLAITK